MRTKYLEKKKQSQNAFSFGQTWKESQRYVPHKKEVVKNFEYDRAKLKQKEIDRVWERQVEKRKEIGTQNKIFKEEQTLFEQTRDLRKKDLKSNVSAKRFKYELDQILNQEKSCKTSNIQKNEKIQQRQYQNKNNPQKRDTLKSITNKYSNNKILKYDRKNDSEVYGQRQKQVQQIRIRNKICNNDTQFGYHCKSTFSEIQPKQIKISYSPSIEVIKRKYGYQNQAYGRQLIEVSKPTQKKRTIYQQKYQNQFKQWRREKSTNINEKTYSKFNHQILSQNITGHRKNRLSQLCLYQHHRQGQQNQQFDQIAYLAEHKQAFRPEKSKYSLLKEKYSHSPYHDHFIQPQQANPRSEYQNHNRQRIKTCEGIGKTLAQHDLNIENSLDYQQVHRTLESTADWMKKSICNLDAKIHERLSRIIPERERTGIRN